MAPGLAWTRLEDDVPLQLSGFQVPCGSLPDEVLLVYIRLFREWCRSPLNVEEPLADTLVRLTYVDRHIYTVYIYIYIYYII